MRETILGDESGYQAGHKFVFKRPRTVDYRASVHDIAKYLLELMKNPQLREQMGIEGRKRVVENFDYRVIARKFVDIVSKRLGIS